MSFLDVIDPRVRPSLERELERRAHDPIDGIPRAVTVVLAGHRAAGKSTLAPHVAALLGRQAIDLDHELERRAGRSLREWVRTDEPSFRVAERELFRNLEVGSVVAVGGGFLSHHPDLLRGVVTALVPITFETFRERLLADVTRPRLRPELTLEEELRVVFTEREALHRRAPTISLVDLLLAAKRRRPRRVVTLPPGESLEFASRARHAGAELLELRTDLHDARLEASRLSNVLPLLVAERDRPLPSEWTAAATLVDAPHGTLRSLHAPAPLTPEEALARWNDVPRGVLVKHVEPLGELSTASRLFETHAALKERFGADRVTVLATGPLATAFRCVLAEDNTLDFLSLDGTWSAAPGQRLLADAIRAHRFAVDGRRLAIIGDPVAHSRSPRVHRQPFDRLQVPVTVDLPAFLAAVNPHYQGFAVTAPLKKLAAKASGSSRDALNTLVREGNRYVGADSDREGARACLEALMAKATGRLVTVLGDGGVVASLREAADALGLSLEVHRRADVRASVTGPVVWTWPASVTPPAALRLDGAFVAIIAYGPPAHAIARLVRERGGTPLRLGPRWFIAQAREQRRLWESST